MIGAVFLFLVSIASADTICEKYSKALGVTQIQLMDTIVKAVVTAEVSDPAIKLFFDGTLPPNSINFLANMSAFNRLANNLIAFFGAAIGCMDPTFPVYNGNKNMKAVHMFMPIDYDAFEKFNVIFIQALAKLGVDAGDQAAIRGVLDSFAPAIINPRIICGKYAQALGVSEVQLMQTVVSAVVKAELGEPTVLPFFNGQTPPGSINYLTNQTGFQNLAGNLIAFFGGALGCTQDFPPYRGNPSMKMVHAKMPITNLIFSNFNNVFQQTLGNLGVSRGDQMTIRMILDSFAQFIVNT